MRRMAGLCAVAVAALALALERQFQVKVSAIIADCN